MKFPTINKNYFILKAHFFLFQAGIAPTQTAAPVYAQTLGFSSFIVGLIFTILPILAIIIKPVSGAVADRFKWHKQVMLVVEVICLVTYFSIQFIPSGFSPPTISRSHGEQINVSFSLCSGGIGIHPYLKADRSDNLLKRPCTIKCKLTPDLMMEYCNYLPLNDDSCYFYTNISSQDSEISPFKQTECRLLDIKNMTAPILTLKKRLDSKATSNCSLSCEEGKNFWDIRDTGGTPTYQEDSTTLQQYQFYVFLLLLLGGWGGTTVVTTLSDTICIAKCADPNDYGKQRLWGSVGYGVLSIISGFIVDFISGADHKDYTPAFYLTLATMGLDIILTQFLLKVEIPARSQNIAKDVWKSLLSIKLVVFLVWCVAMGVSMGLSWTFLYWLLEDLAREQGPETVAYIKTIEGLTNGVQTFLGETPAFFFAGWVLTQIGHSHCITVILFTIGLRFTIYSFLTNPWFVLFVEPLQLYYGLFYCTMTSYANLVAPPGTQATVQSIMCAMCEGIGVAVGSFIGGYLYNEYKGPTTFRIFGVAFFIMAMSNEIIEFLCRFLQSNEEVLTHNRKVVSEHSSQAQLSES